MDVKATRSVQLFLFKSKETCLTLQILATGIKKEQVPLLVEELC